ncbi:TPA: hypothetical protein N0F65_002339 [Lagenidium giganteum]|uniref:Uncharacterized protein n=1 Tax=Lagenidium giganteum TaxID=4803 RepID=A0AAV2Z6L8_9STRA|nr:TPA: hypothetical protein N0F65_002339 [Lagenidium giganteum]
MVSGGSVNEVDMEPLKPLGAPRSPKHANPKAMALAPMSEGNDVTLAMPKSPLGALRPVATASSPTASPTARKAPSALAAFASSIQAQPQPLVAELGALSHAPGSPKRDSALAAFAKQNPLAAVGVPKLTIDTGLDLKPVSPGKKAPLGEIPAVLGSVRSPKSSISLKDSGGVVRALGPLLISTRAITEASDAKDDKPLPESDKKELTTDAEEKKDEAQAKPVAVEDEHAVAEAKSSTGVTGPAEEDMSDDGLYVDDDDDEARWEAEEAARTDAARRAKRNNKSLKKAADEAKAPDAKAVVERTPKEEAVYPEIDSEVLGGHLQTATSGPTPIFVPNASDIDLFHAVLAQDMGQLSQLLQGMTPSEVLAVRDTEERTVFHYAAMSNSVQVKRIVFGHAIEYVDSDIREQIREVLTKNKQFHSVVSANTTSASSKQWIPPRAQELELMAANQRQSNITDVLSATDSRGRTALHYAASHSHELTFERSSLIADVFKARRELAAPRVTTYDAPLRTDRFGRTPLHYAVEHGNIALLKWLFSVGAARGLTSTDLDEMLTSNIPTKVYHHLISELESVDHQRHHARTRAPTATTVSGTTAHGLELGASVCMAAKLEPENIMSPDGHQLQTALHRAAVYANRKALQPVLAEGANVDTPDANGWTALHHCAHGGTTEHVQFALDLLQAGANINARSAKGRTPLHVAVKHVGGKVHDQARAKRTAHPPPMLVCLTESGADVNKPDLKGHTPLLLACREGMVIIVKHLLANGADRALVDSSRQTCLHVAATSGHGQLLEFLCRWDAEARVWLDANDGRGRTPLMSARNEDCKQRMTVHNQLPFCDIHCNLWVAAVQGDVDTVQAHLGRHSARGSHSHRQAAVIATHDRTDETGRTALHLAKLHQQIKLRRDITQQKDSKCISVPPDRSAFTRRAIVTIDIHFQAYVAVVHHTSWRTNELILDSSDLWGVTPLMLAACTSDVSVWPCLLGVARIMDTMLQIAQEGDLNAKDMDGNTALHYAYAFGQVDFAHITSALEAFMDDTEPTNKSGKVPLDMAGLQYRAFPKSYQEHLARVSKWKQRLAAG